MIPYVGAVVPPLSEAALVVDITRPEVRDTYAGFKDRVKFQWTPENINTSVAPSWEQVAVLGRSEPFWIYANTGSKTISFDFRFAAQGWTHAKTSILNSIELEVNENVRFLESLAYPIRGSDGLSTEPAPCFLVIGSLIVSRVIMSGPATVTYEGPWEVESHFAYQASVNCEFTEVNQKPKEARDVLTGRADNRPPDMGTAWCVPAT